MAEQREQAELAYQRALAALHDVRADLADVMAARRRLAFDRPALTSEVADQRSAELDARRAVLEARAGVLRNEAEELRGILRQGTDASGEPTEVDPSPQSDGFEQPPYLMGRP
ncbi:MAG TPA: hypothetical protein PKV13_09985 [Propionicimonas sp.]|nr:hypothetical protein [Propionicimonas sp.]HRA06933.1 hypothetical protein [Propionicimonas sp.]